MNRLLTLVIVAIVALPALLIVAVSAGLVRLSSSGPAIFRQQRVGRDGVPFTCYKLRSMRPETPDAPTHQVDQSAVTPVGRVLRATKIDELPQLWNVVLGEMALVGPRPCLPSQHALIDIRSQRGALRLRPGITGLAQVCHIDMSRPRLISAVDALYARRRSTMLDLRILVATVFGGFRSAKRRRRRPATRWRT